MTKTDLREAFAQQHENWLIGTDDDAETAQEWVMENLPSLLALLPDGAGWRPEEKRLGSWMSAALDDPNVCDEMKADISAWFAALPTPPEASGEG